MEIKMFILKNYNCGQQSMGNEVLSHALNSETNAIAETSNPGSQLMWNEVLSHALNLETNAITETSNSETNAIAETSNSEVNAIVETSNSSNNASPGDLIGWRDTPITEIDVRSFNPFRFSSEYHDDELSLIYYNYRHYNPTTGRFLSRDPIEEQGGTNLYNFTTNDSVNSNDFLGLQKSCEIILVWGHRGDVNDYINKNKDKYDPKTCAFGPLGCLVNPAPNGYRIDGFIDLTKHVIGESEDSTNGGLNPNDGKTEDNRRQGFANVLTSAFNSAMEEVTRICECSDCKVITIRFNGIGNRNGEKGNKILNRRLKNTTEFKRRWKDNAIKKHNCPPKKDTK